jgi:outer membrane protein assembly factor BamB
MGARTRGIAAATLLTAALAGCSTTSSTSVWNPTSWAIPAPSFDWLTGRGEANKPGPLPELKATVNPVIAWQAGVGRARPGLAPAVSGNVVYAAALDGTLMRLDADTGRVAWRVSAGRPLSAGPGADGTLVAVGTEKGDVLAFDTDGKPLWSSRVSSEVMAPPVVSEGVVVVTSGDGRIFGLDAADGKTKWVHQRTNPPLTVRNTAGGEASRGGVFIGTAGGRLLAIDVQTGTVGWDGTVAAPKGATELERIADVTSRPAVEERQACAVAFQGRIACFEILRGNVNWTRDLSSLTGIAADETAFYVADATGALHALDKSTGASLWKQDLVAPRKPMGVQVTGDYLAVLDIQGYVHLFEKATGNYVGRLASDGTPPTGQPQRLGERVIWQSLGGSVYAVGVR